MNSRFTFFSLRLASTLALILGPGLACSEAGEGAGVEANEATGEVGAEIRNGTITTPWATGSTDTFGKSVVYVGGCTGTLVDPSWVLTARHCLTTVGTTITSRRPSGNVDRTVDAVEHNLDMAIDTTMLHLSSPFTDVPIAPIYPDTTGDIVGHTVTCYGYGAKASGQACDHTNPATQCNAGDFCSHWDVCLTPSSELRKANLTATALDSNIFQTPANGLGQTMLPGDSGGPCNLGGRVAGVNSYGNVGGGAQASVPASYEFINSPSRVMYTTGDFNGDGKIDVIVTTPAGSSWYYAATNLGTWNIAYQRPDLSLGNVKFTPGDFNGDGKTDVIITTPTGSYWYYSTGTGTWNTTAYQRADLQMHLVNFTVGNFDGDAGHKDDVIITTAAGSFWYYSTGTGTWNTTAYQRTDLPYNVASYTPGDFNGDGKTDVIISTPASSYWYYSTGLGTWDMAYHRDDLPAGSAKYTTGDFNGDGRTDMIVTSETGSYWYYGSGTGTWFVGDQRTDLPLRSVKFTVGNFDGDGNHRDDVIISTPTGSYWYYMLPNGTWNTTAYQRTDLKLYDTQFVAADFSGNGMVDMIITNPTGSYWYFSTGLGTWNTTAYQRLDLPR